MNRVRRLVVVGALTMTTLGLAVDTTFAASGITSYSSNAPDGAGNTIYQTDDGHYQIYDVKDDGHDVAVRFYFSAESATTLHFLPCHKGAGNNCSGTYLPRRSGVYCMETGVGHGTQSSDYKFGRERCFGT